MTTVTIFAKADYVSREGTIPLYLRLTIDRKVYPPFNLSLRVKPEHWDSRSRQVRRSHAHHQKINMLLSRELSRAQEILLDHRLAGRPVTFETFRREFAGQGTYNFFDMADEYRRSRVGTDTNATIEKIYHVVNKVREYCPQLDLQQVNYEFLVRYRQHLATVRKNSKSTIHSNMKILRRIVLEGVRRKLIRENPFDNFPLESVRGHRESLSLAEFRQYEELLKENLPFYLRKTLCWFILAVYTGRRFQDLEQFYSWEFSSDQVRIVQMKHIRGRQERKTIVLFLNQKIRSIVATIREARYEPLSNAKANKFLKEINARVGMTRNITFHSARHTFATINKRLTADLSVRRDLLGHDSVKSTLIYDHLDEELLKSAMLRWDSLN